MTLTALELLDSLDKTASTFEHDLTDTLDRDLTELRGVVDDNEQAKADRGDRLEDLHLLFRKMEEELGCVETNLVTAEDTVASLRSNFDDLESAISDIGDWILTETP